MTHAEILAQLDRRGPIRWGELSDLILADLWYRMCDYRARTGKPMPPDHLRPHLADSPKADS